MLRGRSHCKMVVFWLILFSVEVGGHAMKISSKSFSGKDETKQLQKQIEVEALADCSRIGFFDEVLPVLRSGLRKTHSYGYIAFEPEDYVDSLTAAVKEFLSSLHLLEDGCSITIFSEQGAEDAASRMGQVLRDRPLKTFQLKKDVLERKVTWTRTLSDCYLFFLHDFDDFKHHAAVSHYHHSIHDSQPSSLWNYQAYYFVILPHHHRSMSLGPLDIFSLYNFQKTQRVIVFQPEGDCVLTWSHQLYKPGSGERYLGAWKRGGFHGRLPHLFKGDLEDFEGDPLRVATFDHPPSVVYAHDKYHKIVNRFGVDMQIVKRLAWAMNFTPEFLEVPHDELWGYELQNGTWTGLVGKVFYEYADIGACNVFLELHRWKMVDYSAPYNFERGCFVAPSPKPILNWKSPISPFSWDTWTSIGACLLAGGFLLYLMAALSINPESVEFLGLSYAYLYIMASMTVRSTYIVPSHAPLRVYIGFFWLFCLILSTAYSANLVAFLSVTEMSAPIDSMKDLSASGLRIGGVAFWKTQFSASIDPVVQNFAKVLESDVDLSALFDRVEAGDFALIENKQYLEVQAGARYTYGSRTTIRLVGECLLPYSIGLAFQKNSPLKQAFDGVILRLFESGVVSKWKEEVVDYFRQQYKEKRLERTEVVLSGSQPLTLKQLQGVFYVMAIGCLLSTLILLTEILTYMF